MISIPDASITGLKLIDELKANELCPSFILIRMTSELLTMQITVQWSYKEMNKENNQNKEFTLTCYDASVWNVYYVWNETINVSQKNVYLVRLLLSF